MYNDPSNAAAPGSCLTCPPGCSQSVFERVVVSYLIRGGTTVAWTLSPAFTDNLPYVFTLQVGQSDNPNANDWTDVGAPVTNVFYAVDGEQREYGKLRFQFYRVMLATSQGVYYSDPTGLMGVLDKRSWRIARETLRQELVRMRNGKGGQLGYLLKRRITGIPCPRCLDYQTREILNPACPECWGTGFYCGYFFPIACAWADLGVSGTHYNLDSTRGTTADITVPARIANSWLLVEKDVWVDAQTDDRYYIHAVHNVAEIQSVPLIAQAEMRLAPASDPIYSLQIDGQARRLSVLQMEGE